MKKNIILLIFLTVILGCSSKIKSITEFSNKDGILSKIELQSLIGKEINF